eukprot:15366658-Ditylum_brightwellii.AAC.1
MAFSHHTHVFTTKSSTTSFSTKCNSLYTAISTKSSSSHTALSFSIAKTSNILEGIQDQILQNKEICDSNLNYGNAAVTGLEMHLVTGEGEGGLLYL